MMTSLVIRQQNIKKVTYTDKCLVLQLDFLFLVHISVYVYCPNSPQVFPVLLQTVTGLAVLYVPVARTILGYH